MAEKDKEAYSEMTVAELKKILKSKKLPISGSKKKLIERLTDKNWKKKHELKKMKKYGLYTSLSSRIWEKYNLEIVFLSPIFVILLWFTYSVTVSEKGWSQFGWDDLVELLRMFGGLVLICLIFIVPMVIVAIGLDNVLDSFKQSKNPAVKANPVITAENYIRFTREADPKIKTKFKGFKPYGYQGSEIVALPTEGLYEPGDIIYDPISKDFLVFDNTGGTYRLDPLTFEIQE